MYIRGKLWNFIVKAGCVWAEVVAKNTTEKLKAFPFVVAYTEKDIKDGFGKVKVDFLPKR